MNSRCSVFSPTPLLFFLVRFSFPLFRSLLLTATVSPVHLPFFFSSFVLDEPVRSDVSLLLRFDFKVSFCVLLLFSAVVSGFSLPASENSLLEREAGTTATFSCSRLRLSIAPLSFWNSDAVALQIEMKRRQVNSARDSAFSLIWMVWMGETSKRGIRE